MDKSTIEMAIIGLEEQKKKIEQALAELRIQLNGGGTNTGRMRIVSVGGETIPGRRSRRKMSAEARRKISEGMKRRYAEMRRLSHKRAA